MTASPSATAARDALLFVVGVNDIGTFQQRLMQSPCLQPGGWPVIAHVGARSAAEAFNGAMDGAARAAGVRWLIWVHQDVVLPVGWDVRFLAALAEAEQRFPRLAVAGVYGLEGTNPGARRAGHLLDRGEVLREPTPLPCPADSLDELLFAVRTDSGLRLDPDLGYDFYATDVVLQAQARGLQAAVVDAYCEHWSSTPKLPPFKPSTVARVLASARAFERKWAARLPVSTPCFDISRPGDVERFLALVEGRPVPP